MRKITVITLLLLSGSAFANYTGPLSSTSTHTNKHSPRGEMHNSGSAFANYTGPSSSTSTHTRKHSPYGEMRNIATSPTTVQQIKASGVDNQRVVLQGKIVRHVAKNNYVFADSSGEISVKIKPRTMESLAINENTTVELLGKLDKDFGELLKVDVKRLEIVQ